MPLSSRSVPTGPGSRGGLDPSVRRARWIAAHPEYQSREQARMATRNRSRLQPVLFSEAVREVLREQCQESSIRKVAEQMAVCHTTLSRWFKDEKRAPVELLDSAVAQFGLDRIRAKRAQLRRAA